MKGIFWPVVLVICGVVLIPGLIGLAITKIPSGYQPSLSDSEQILAESVVSQSFTAKQNGLSGFAVTVRNPFNSNKQPLNMSLLQNGVEIRKVSLNGANIPDGGYMDFNFTPVPDSGGKTYSAVFTTVQGVSQFPFGIYHSNQPYNGVYQVNGQMHEGSLSFITYYAPKNIVENFIVIYQSWMDKFFKDLGFAIIYSSLILLSTIYLYREFLTKRTN